MPNLQGPATWISPAGTVMVISLSTSGVVPPSMTLASKTEIAQLRSHLPSGVATADPQWIFDPRRPALAVAPGDDSLGFPPYLVVLDGVVAYYSELAFPKITYYVDDRGLEAYLRAPSFQVKLEASRPHAARPRALPPGPP